MRGGLLAVGAPTLDAPARPYTKADMDRVQYTWQMPRREHVFLNLDWRRGWRTTVEPRTASRAL